ncbi:MAG: FHA domain-containing protein [Myxococcales bacterium]|nr:FHA domain-containing protein [Myxococcales bacterium]
MVLSIEARPELRSVEPQSQSSLHVVLVLHAHGQAVDVRPPLSCVLSLDASGSMHGEPLEQAIRSVQLAADLASPTDALGLVVFETNAAQVVPLTPMDEPGKRLLRARAERLRAGGNTNIEAALRIAAKQLCAADPCSRRSILLLSDGSPNEGMTSARSLRELAKSGRPHMGISCLGYGPKHDEDILGAIAEGGGGRYAFVPHPLRCRRELAMALGAQGDVVADGIEVALQPAEGVEIVRVVGQSDLRWSNKGLIAPLADMDDDAKQVLPILVRLPGVISPKGLLIRVRLRHRCARTGEVIEQEVEVTIDVKAGTPEPDPIVTEYLLLAYGAEERARARSMADRGQFAGAAEIIRQFLYRFASLPPAVVAPGSALGELRESLVDDVVAYDRRPSAEAYANFRKHTMNGQPPSLLGRSKGGALSRDFGKRTAGLFQQAAVVVVGGPWAGHRFSLGESNAIGRTPSSDIPLPSPLVSHRHAEIYAVEGEYWICDLGSTNLTSVNGRRVANEPCKLTPGDVIRVGDVDLRFELGSAIGIGLAGPAFAGLR